MRLILLLAFLTAFHNITQAQELTTKDYTASKRKDNPKTQVGFHLGYSQHKMSGSEVDFILDPVPTSSYRPIGVNKPLKSLVIGGVVQHLLYKFLFIRGEVNYLQKGGKVTNPGLVNKDAITIDYLQVPLLLHAEAPVAGPVALYVEGGCTMNAALNDRKYSPQYFAPGNVFSNNTIIFSPTIGGGISWTNAAFGCKYFMDFRYSLDTKDFATRDYMNKSYTLRHQGFTISAGALFGL